MSIYKGTQLIATNGAPGADGRAGNTIGHYTLGEIIKALQNAGILTPSV